MENNKEEPGLIQVLKNVWLVDIPSYANKIYYSLGFLSMIAFTLLVITGIVLTFFGPDWWLISPVGVLTRSIHLWAVQAFVIFVILHLLIVFLTGGYRAPRQFVWVLGSLMFFFSLAEAEFGYVLRNDFSSQWRSLQGADFWNGTGMGTFINNLNYAQIYGIHVVVIPFIIIFLLFLHYALVRLRGIAKPYRKDVPYHMVKANHTILFFRGFVLICVIIALAAIFPSPIIEPVTVKQVAIDDPALMATTLITEIDHSSDTATYVDNIAPYQYDTKKVYVDVPYMQYISLQQNKQSMLDYFNAEDQQTQTDNLKAASDYFTKNGQLTTEPNTKNPVIPLISSLVLMGQQGLYEAVVLHESDTNYNPTYLTRFIADTGVPEDKATSLKITTPQYGMLREEKGFPTPGAWWLAPLGLLDNTLLQNDDNQDRDGAEIVGIFMLLFTAFPYIPFLNKFPDKLGVYKLIWKEKSPQKSS
ncbi:MAG TPA: cytochrome b N-terminal domain-containing protein [Candidatus Acidoferrales bacterium]|nr:cytochrome b N-terminal domain-containing protein [Candidatus Acidoferrales bacterium]